MKVAIPIGVNLSVEQCPKAHEEEEDMSHVPVLATTTTLLKPTLVENLNGPPRSLGMKIM